MSPVFVVGYPRSGTTLLLHLLMSSGEFPTYRFSESHFFSHCYRRYGSLRRERNRRALLDELASREWFSGTDVTRDELLERVGDETDSYEAYFRSFMELVAEHQGKTRWLEKTPWHFKYMPEITNAFPECRFLIMVRDPRDVVLSIAKYGWTSDRPGRLLRTAIAWDWAMRYIDARIRARPESCLVVRYEDLVGDTQAELGKINAFLGLDIDVAALDESGFGVMAGSNSSYGRSAERGITAASVGRWRERMPAELVPLFDYVLRDSLPRYGYAAGTTTRAALPDRSRLDLMRFGYGAAKRARYRAFPLVRR